MSDSKNEVSSGVLGFKIFKSMKGKWVIAVIAVTGAFLLILGSFSSAGKAESSKRKIEFSSYTSMLENKIEALCRSVSGITEAEVLLTLDNGSEYVYARNQTESKDGSHIRQTFDYVITDRGSGGEAVPVTEIYPNVRGVAVVCTGGDTPSVQEKIISLLSAALGLPSNKISVAGSG